MSVRNGSPAGLRAGARDLRTSAARVGLAAWSAHGQAGPVTVGWWGIHSQLWLSRDRFLVDALRLTEAGLRAAATATERYADDVERAQQQLDRLDEETAALQARERHEVAQWQADPPPARGPRPDLGPLLAAVDGRRRAVEAEAERAGRVFAQQVRAAVDGLPRVDTLRSVLTNGYVYGYALPSGVGTLAGGPAEKTGRTLVPKGWRGPLKAFDRRFGPARFLANADVLAGNGSNTGARGAADKVMAGVDMVALGGVYLTAGGALATTTVVGGVTVGTVAAGAAVASAVYLVGTTLWDKVLKDKMEDRPRSRPSRPRPLPVVGPRVPRPLLPPGAGLTPLAGPPPGFTTVPRPAPARPLGPPTGLGPRPVPVGPLVGVAPRVGPRLPVGLAGTRGPLVGSL